MRIIMWGREGSTFIRKSDDGENEIRVAFKKNDHVSITVRCGVKRAHRELRLRYGRTPHVGVLAEAINMWKRLTPDPEGIEW